MQTAVGTPVAKTNGKVVSTLGFIEQSLNIKAKDYLAETDRVTAIVAEKYPDEARFYNHTMIIKVFRSKLAGEGRSKDIGRLYLPLILSFMRGYIYSTIYLDQLYEWVRVSRDKYGFRGLTFEKVEAIANEINESDFPGLKKFEIKQDPYKKAPTIYRQGISYSPNDVRQFPTQYQPRTDRPKLSPARGETTMSKVKQILKRPEFEGWEVRASAKKVNEILEAEGVTGKTDKMIANYISKIRLKHKLRPQSS